MKNVAIDPILKRNLRPTTDTRAKVRDHYATFMVHNGLIKEEVDLLQGRVGKSIFMLHYFSPNIEDLRDRVLTEIDKMLRPCLGLRFHACASNVEQISIHE